MCNCKVLDDSCVLARFRLCEFRRLAQVLLVKFLCKTSIGALWHHALFLQQRHNTHWLKQIHFCIYAVRKNGFLLPVWNNHFMSSLEHFPKPLTTILQMILIEVFFNGLLVFYGNLSFAMCGKHLCRYPFQQSMWFPSFATASILFSRFSL